MYLELSVTYVPKATWHTLVINVSGSFALGLLIEYAALRGLPHSRAMHQFFAIGFIGAYTTFSTFEMEIYSLQRTQPMAALLYAMGSVGLGYGAFLAGLWIIRR